MADPRIINFPELSHRLLAWFFQNKREMPWREEHNPYRIWISEVMLQQTRNETAAEYYRRWLERFPTIESLARAQAEEVLKTWEGLGYYSRARNLHASARIIVYSRAGVFPDTEEEIRSLPGVGEYTAAAVLSIAFAKPLGVVDGNVLRVVSRLLAEDGSVDHGSGQPRSAEGDPIRRSPTPRSPAGRLKKLVRVFVEASFLHYHPGWINQAWMELGALVCLPNPRCPQCPLGYTCLAYREERIDEFPPKLSTKPLPVRTESLLLLLPPPASHRLHRDLEIGLSGSTDNKSYRGLGAALRDHNLPLLLVRRADSGLLGGLWELPNYPERGEGLTERLRRLSIEIILDTGMEVRHRYSHFEIRFRIFVAVFVEQQQLDSWVDQRWVPPAELESYPRPKVHIEAMKRVGLVAR
jgi:A/G-specific adenine glycosylase